MSAVTQTDPDFTFAVAADTGDFQPAITGLGPGNPLGPLADLPGTWKGHGFNTIWRPHHGGQDRFLELNLTTETLVFTKINGPIPNRGFLMPDISMFGLTYMQQISETSSGAGLHIEPGIWAHVPPTSNPGEPSTVVRMASIPHGTVILAQGTTQTLNGGPPHIPDNNIIPFPIGSPPPANSDFASGEAAFPELNLSIPTTFRAKSPGVTQEMVRNPNSVLQHALSGETMHRRTFISISTRHSPIQGGGTANTAFLSSASNPPGGNANAVEVDATFWIEHIAGGGGDVLQLQYTQLVQLDFNGLRWPHVTVATLRKQ
ncbi:MAG TPA: heme-binding protein [Solirubrobacteraceae bacterium]|nr:heme-binding protein [Solirubrobacteraceae bacterium]